MTTYIVVHVCCSKQIHAIVVGELGLVDIGAVGLNVGTVVDVVVVIHESNTSHPVPSGLGPGRVGFVVGVASKTRTEVEEAAVRNAVLVVISVVGEGNLPSQTATTSSIVSSRVSLGVEDGLSQGKPLRLSLGRIGEVLLGGKHSSHSPETLIVVSERCCDVGGHVVLIGANLP